VIMVSTGRLVASQADPLAAQGVDACRRLIPCQLPSLQHELGRTTASATGGDSAKPIKLGDRYGDWEVVGESVLPASPFLRLGLLAQNSTCCAFPWS
jgi:hypothetical protein